MSDLTLIVEKNKDGFWAQVKEHEGVFTFGVTIEELKVNAIEALELAEIEFNKQIDFSIQYDIQEFFASHDYINISKLAQRTGMNSSLLRQYASGIKFPGESQIKKIENAIHQIAEELKQTKIISQHV